MSTRRSTGGTRAKSGPAKGQSTISFSNRVTKPVPKDTKAALIESASTKKAEAEVIPEPIREEVKVDEVEAEEVPEEVPQEATEPTEIPEAVPEQPESELRAEKITDSQLSKYWKQIESERLAPRVHQGDLTLSEKILRYFDVSSQYGVSEISKFP
jgi:DNA polymerase delta subunit 4